MNRWGIKYHDDEAYMDYDDDGDWVWLKDVLELQAKARDVVHFWDRLRAYCPVDSLLGTSVESLRAMLDGEQSEQPK